MSEKTKNPEAQTQTIIDLYRQAANYLETAIHTDEAQREPAAYTQVAMLKVTAQVPELNGKKLKLEYDRPAADDDPTQVDRDIPLAWNDESGRNHWQTPIRVAVYGQDEQLLHDYHLEYAGGEEWARATDDALQPGQAPDEYGTITQLDANELIGHIEWAMENQS